MPPGYPEPLDPAFHLVADRGGVFIDGSSHGLKILTEAGYSHPDMSHWPLHPTGLGGALAASLERFIVRLIAGDPPLVGLDDARRAQEVVAAMKRSIATGVPVEYPFEDEPAYD